MSLTDGMIDACGARWYTFVDRHDPTPSARAALAAGVCVTRQPLRVGAYSVWSAFARGGVASVHLACRTGAGGFARTVAVKRLHPQHARDGDFAAMLIDEARLSAQVHHPNVVSVHDVVQHDDEVLLVMDYVHGVALADLLARSGTASFVVPTALAVAVLIDVLEGLFAASTAKDAAGQPLGIVHRDVSPQNILVGADGICRVVDFGIVKATTRLQLTKEGEVKGKTAYLSPEQLMGREATPRSDAYAAAVVLWEMLMGRPLHGRKTGAATAMSILEEVPAAARTMRPEAPLALSAVLEQALSKAPEDRYPDAKSFAAALRSAQPRAGRSEVGEWVERFFGEELKERAAECERNERETSPPRARLVTWQGGAIATASTIVVVLVLLMLRGQDARRRGEPLQSSPATAGSFGDPVPPEMMLADPVPPQTMLPGELPAAASVASPPAPAPAPARSVRDTGARSVRRSKDLRENACDPPWEYIDGIKRIKPACL